MGVKGWRGMLAPLDVSTGDGRRFLSSGVSNRQLPMALKWQREDSMGHDASVIVGSCAEINYGTVAEAIDKGWIDAKCVKPSKFPGDLRAAWGSGTLFDVDPQKMPRLAEDISEATFLLEQKVIGPSVDTGSAEAVVAKKGSDEALTDEELDALFWDESSEDVELEMLFTEYEIAAATLVAIPAFAECRPFELFDVSETVTAAVRKSGWSGIPLAERDMAWDGTAAEKRVAEQAGIGGESPDWDSYAEAFLYQNDDADSETKGAYGFQIVDIVDDDRSIVPRAVFAVAGVLQGARGGTTIPEADQTAMKGVVETLYNRMAEEFDDPSITVPWAGESAALIAALTAAAPAYDPAMFANPELKTITPITITENGEVFGHVATHSTCHVGVPGECVTAPLSGRGYVDFHRYAVTGTDGQTIQTGRITTGHSQFVCGCRTCRGSNDDHACLQLNAAGAIAHHDKMSTVAWVRVGEDERNNAIWVHGVINSMASIDDIASLSRARVSGDWRPMGGQSELVEILSLAKERPGFPLPRVRMLAGQASVLTAAGVVRPTSAPSSSAETFEIDYERLGKIITAGLAPLVAASTVESVVDVETDATRSAVADPVADDVASLLAEVSEAVEAADDATARSLMDEIGRI